MGIDEDIERVLYEERGEGALAGAATCDVGEGLMRSK
jgi:hypothetical protein